MTVPPSNEMPNSAGASVAILLATFNGAAFLREQLESIERQTHRDWRIFWHDDGSADDTCAIIEAWGLRDRVTRVGVGAQRLGVLGSFMDLLRFVPAECDYIAFCDQDDVWQPEKLARACDWLRGCVAESALYCGRQTLVDSELKQIGLSAMPHRMPGFRNALVQNIAVGCTIVLNAQARREILQAPPPPEGSFHDWWSYLVVSGVGGMVLFDPQPEVLYRQHARNAVGAAAGLVTRGLRAWRRGRAEFLWHLADHIVLLANYRGLSAENAATMSKLTGFATASALLRWMMLWRAGLYRQSLAESIALYPWTAAPLHGGGARLARPEIGG
jgi:glycosyltransferase involved in cell wall biosynthesis